MHLRITTKNELLSRVVYDGIYKMSD